MFSLQKHNMENIKSFIKVFMAIFLPVFYVILYICISYVVLSLLLISIKFYFLFTERSTISDYMSGSFGGSLTSAIFIRFYYISDEG